MAQDEVDARAQAERELGQKQAALMKLNAPSRICGLLTARGRSVDWDKAFEHIAEHFKADPLKPKHTCFQSKYCEKEAVKALIKDAAGRPSSVIWAKLTIGGMPAGRPGIKIVRDFAEPIGDRADLVCLIIIADHQGKLVTAYPGTRNDL
jgi:hypothetical protein